MFELLLKQCNDEILALFENFKTTRAERLIYLNQPIATNNSKISASVGHKGINHPEDVKLIQNLLNTKNNSKLVVDGIAGAKTKNAIAIFQRDIVKMPQPDGRVDVNMNTWKALIGQYTPQPIQTTPQPIQEGKEPSKAEEKGLWESIKEKASNLSSAVANWYEDAIKGKSIFDISASVGRGGKNIPEDVAKMRYVMIHKKILSDMSPSNQDYGIADSAFCQAIYDYQKDIMKMPNADGRIDPNGVTWKALNNSPSIANPTIQPNTNIENKTQPIVGEKIEIISINASILEFIKQAKALYKSNPYLDLFESTFTKGLGTISDSVGINAANKKEDVLIIHALLARHNTILLEDIVPKGTTKYEEVFNNVTLCTTKTIDAIKKFQGTILSGKSIDGIISPSGITLKRLNANATVNNYFDPNADSNKLNLHGAETEVEKKLEVFTKIMNGIEICINPGEAIPKYVYVRPSYTITVPGDTLTEIKSNLRVASSKVLAILRKHKIIYGEGSNLNLYGQHDAVTIKALLEDCIKSNITEAGKTAESLRDFLGKYGACMDCSGLASQALNFLLDGNLSKSDNKITYATSETLYDKNNYYDEATDNANKQNTVEYSKIQSPKDLKAGDLMVWRVPSKKDPTKSTGHVRMIIDVDIEKDGVYFTTFESTSDGADKKTQGIMQHRYKFPNKEKFENLSFAIVSEYRGGSVSPNDHKAIYLRHNKLK